MVLGVGFYLSFCSLTVLRSCLLEPLDLQLPLVLVGLLLSLDFHLELGPGLLELLDQGLFVT